MKAGHSVEGKSVFVNVHTRQAHTYMQSKEESLGLGLRACFDEQLSSRQLPPPCQLVMYMEPFARLFLVA